MRDTEIRKREGFREKITTKTKIKYREEREEKKREKEKVVLAEYKDDSLIPV